MRLQCIILYNSEAIQCVVILYNSEIIKCTILYNRGAIVAHDALSSRVLAARGSFGAVAGFGASYSMAAASFAAARQGFVSCC